MHDSIMRQTQFQHSSSVARLRLLTRSRTRNYQTHYDSIRNYLNCFISVFFSHFCFVLFCFISFFFYKTDQFNKLILCFHPRMHRVSFLYSKSLTFLSISFYFSQVSHLRIQTLVIVLSKQIVVSCSVFFAAKLF